MSDNIFEKVEKLAEGQQEILDKIQEIQASSSSQSNTNNPYQAQIQRANQQVTIKNFMKRAEKSYRYMSSKTDFEQEKKQIVYIAFALLCLGILLIPIVSNAAGLYTTFTFIENIWLVFVLIILFQVKRSKLLYECFDFSQHCFMKFYFDTDGTMRKDLFMKKRYRFFQVSACISSISNIICAWMEENTTLAMLVTILEIAFFVLSILILYKADDFFMMYSAIYYTANNDSNTQLVTIVYHETDQKLYTKDDFEKRFSFIN